jgi:hypothetical protein
LLAPLREREPGALAQFDAVQAKLRVLTQAEKAHLDAAHAGSQLLLSFMANSLILLLFMAH